MWISISAAPWAPTSLLRLGAGGKAPACLTFPERWFIQNRRCCHKGWTSGRKWGEVARSQAGAFIQKSPKHPRLHPNSVAKPRVHCPGHLLEVWGVHHVWHPWLCPCLLQVWRPRQKLLGKLNNSWLATVFPEGQGFCAVCCLTYLLIQCFVNLALSLFSVWMKTLIDVIYSNSEKWLDNLWVVNPKLYRFLPQERINPRLISTHFRQCAPF